VVFLLGPVIGWLAARYWRCLGAAGRWALLICCLTSLLLAGCTLCATWSLRGFWANAVNLQLAYIALSALVWLASRKFPRWLAILGLVGFYGVCGLALFVCLVFSEDQIPLRETHVRGDVVACVYRKRFMQSDFDQLKVVDQPNWLPMMEHTLYSRNIKYYECTAASARLAHGSSGDEVQVMCGNRIMDRLILDRKPGP
jgi:hypothetical protein